MKVSEGGVDLLCCISAAFILAFKGCPCFCFTPWPPFSLEGDAERRRSGIECVYVRYNLARESMFCTNEISLFFQSEVRSFCFVSVGWFQAFLHKRIGSRITRRHPSKT
jgi:hypothetical protein